jgi:4-hydroxybenzoate polyprenyltransferase
MAIWRWLNYSLRLRRVEYRIAELPIFLIPALLTVRDPSQFGSVPFWEGLVIFLFLFAFGDLLNCLADRDLDAAYKSHLTEAVYGLGVRGVMLQALLSAAGALALAAHLAWLLDRWLLLAATAAGLGLAWSYSVEPVRLKGRGPWQLAFYWLGLFTGPMVFTALLFSPWPETGVLAVCVTFGMVQTGIILLNTAEDFPEDLEMGVRTVIVALGLRRGLALAVWLAAPGALLLLGAFAWVYLSQHLPWPLWLALAPLAVAAVFAVLELEALRRRTARAELPEAVQAVKRAAARTPLWITSVALASLLAAGAVQWSLYRSVS